MYGNGEKVGAQRLWLLRGQEEQAGQPMDIATDFTQQHCTPI